MSHAVEPSGAYRALFDCNPLPMWVYDSESLAFLLTAKIRQLLDHAS